MKAPTFLKSLLWTALFGLSLSAYLYLSRDAVVNTTEVASDATTADPYHVVGDVLLFKKLVEKGLKVVPQ